MIFVPSLFAQTIAPVIGASRFLSTQPHHYFRLKNTSSAENVDENKKKDEKSRLEEEHSRETSQFMGKPFEHLPKRKWFCDKKRDKRSSEGCKASSKELSRDCSSR